jgi:DNA-binding NarL/FixJ family response regulator
MMGHLDTEDKRSVFLVDDHPLVREWLTNLINQQDDLLVCGEAGDAPEALGKIERLKPDIAIVDITLTSGSGLQLVKDIKVVAPYVKTIVLSMHDEASYAERALRAGARGYVTKCDTTKRIITAVRDVLQGKLFVSNEFKALMAERFLDGGGEKIGIDDLSDRELEVFKMLGQGLGTRQIADSLNLSIKTVQVYCARIKEKQRLPGMSELVREATLWWQKQSGP